MPSIATEYHQLLIDSGLTSPEADRVTRLRTAQNRASRPNPIRVEVVDDEEAEMYIHEQIGFDFWSEDGFTPKKLVEQLKAAGSKRTLNVSVNSPGGDVFDSFTIYNLLNRHEGKIRMTVDGLAASAASLLIQAADPGELRISEAGTVMIHSAWAGVVGNKTDMRSLADVLEKLDGQIANIYSARSGRPATEFATLMDAETWFSGPEAVENRLADAVIPAKRVAAMLDPDGIKAFKNMPEAARVFFAQRHPLAQAAIANAEVNSPEAKQARARRLRILELSE